MDIAGAKAWIPRSAFGRLGALIIACALISFAAPWAGNKIASLYELAIQSNPYFVPAHGIFLYLLVPIITLAALFFVITPGLLIASTLRPNQTFNAWVLKGFAINLLLLSAFTALIESILGHASTGLSFWFLIVCLSVAAYIFAWLRGGKAGLELIVWKNHKVEIAAMLLLPLIVLIVFSPKFYWENFNGDGAHAFLSTKLIIQQFNPFWPTDAGAIAGDPGFTTLLTGYGEAWLVRLFGDSEFSMRALLLLIMPLILCAVMALIRQSRQLTTEKITVGFVSTALFLFCFVFAYNTTYDPYFSDIALPMVRETLLVLCLLGFLYFFLLKDHLFTVIFGVFTYLTVPSGLPLLAFWMLSVGVIWRPIPWRSLITVLGIILGCIGASVLLPMLLAWVGQPVPGNEFNTDGVLQRLRYVSFLDFERFAYWIVPVGILPALSLVFFWRQDKIAKTITLMTVMYFLLFYFQGYRVLLHHFVPVIILPLIVLWRYDETTSARARTYTGAGLVGALVVSFVVSMPSSFKIHTYARSIGEQFSITSDEVSPVDNLNLLAASHDLIFEMYPPRYAAHASDDVYLATPLPLYIYARQAKRLDQVINYEIIMQEQETATLGTLVATYKGYQLFVRDQALHDAHRITSVTSSAQNPMYYARRSVVYQGVKDGSDRLVIDIGGVAKQLIFGSQKTPDTDETSDD